MMPGPMELVVVMVVALLVFGPKRLPELGKSLGSGMRTLQGLAFRRGRERGSRHLPQDLS